MSLVAKLKRDELKSVAEELGLNIPEGAKIVQLKELIENCEIYKKDRELIISVIDNVIEEKKIKIESDKNKKSENETKLELEKIKLAQLEKEVELINLRKECAQNNAVSTSNSDSDTINNDLESYIKSIKTLTIPLPTKAESFNLFFQSLEKAFRAKNVPEELKTEILLNILGEKANSFMVYVTEEELRSYDKIKTIVLKQFQPTPQECLDNFRKAQKLSSESYVQFAARLQANFDYYCKLREVSDFNSLRELMISDRIFDSLDREVMTHIAVKQGESFFKPQHMARECDLFLSAKGKAKNENIVAKQETRYPSKSNPRFQKKCVECIFIGSKKE